MHTAAETVGVSPGDLTTEEMYLLLRDAVIPRPIAWVSTVDSAGRSNLAPFSFFSVCSADPPVLGFSVIGRGQDESSGHWQAKDTLSNIRQTREMVINIAPQEMLARMVDTSAPLAPGHSEFEAAGLEALACDIVKAPRVAGVPVALECVLHGIMEIGRDTWVMGRVVKAHLDTRVHLGDVNGQKHRIDLLRVPELKPVGRLGRANYVTLDAVTAVLRPSGPNQ